MKSFTLAGVAAAALLASTFGAFAASDAGTITAVNYANGTITLDNGNTYVIPQTVQSTFPVAIGVKVKVTYEDKTVSKLDKG